MSKKWIISLSIIFVFVAVLLILFWTLFGLSKVEVKFSSTTENLTVSEEEIVDAGKFRFGACVLFEGKKKYLKNIEEKASENPNFAYINVINIETVFPNKFVIHISERERLFAVKFGEEFLVCDRDLRVLEKLSEFTSLQSNEILLENLEIKNESVNVGDFLEVEQNSVKKIYSAFLEHGQDLQVLNGKYEKMSIFSHEEEGKTFFGVEILTFNGRKLVIKNIDFALSAKVEKLLSAESALFSQNTDESGNILKDNEILYVVKTAAGELLPYDSVKDEKNENGESLYNEEDKFPLTYEVLKKCYIQVDNLTLSEHIKRTEKDIYYSIIFEE